MRIAGAFVNHCSPLASAPVLFYCLLQYIVFCALLHTLFIGPRNSKTARRLSAIGKFMTDHTLYPIAISYFPKYRAVLLMASWKCPSQAYNMLRLIFSFSKSPLVFMGSKFAYVTLLTTTSYLAGVLVLDQSLRAVNSKYYLVVMVTPSLPESARAILRKQFILIREVERLQPTAERYRLHAHDARFADTWTKLR